MRIAMATVLLVGVTAVALAQTPGTTTAPSGTDNPISSLPYTPGLNVEFMDTNADPCVDFISTVAVAG